MVQLRILFALSILVAQDALAFGLHWSPRPTPNYMIWGAVLLFGGWMLYLLITQTKNFLRGATTALGALGASYGTFAVLHEEIGGWAAVAAFAAFLGVFNVLSRLVGLEKINQQP